MRLIEKVWFYRHPAKWVLVPLLLPLTALFWLVTSLRRVLYRSGIKSSTTPALPVNGKLATLASVATVKHR